MKLKSDLDTTARDGRKLVYSTGPDGVLSGQGSDCPGCGAASCHCHRPTNLAPGEQSVRVRRERSGRRGKLVTVAHPLMLSREDASSLLRGLKKRCGSGGTLKSEPAQDGRPAYALELQGDHVESVLADLVAAGFDAKRSGG